MKSFYRKRENKGYTLAEILLTVAILLVLMAIAVLAIFTIRKNLRQKALDNKAEIIYTAVQNNLTKLKSNGNSESFAAKRATLVDATPTDAEDENKDIMEAGGISVDRKAHIVTIDGKEVVLSVKEFELLTYFIQNAGIALSRDRILNGVWNYDYFGDARTIDTHVKKLRAKLGDKGNYIKTIWGMGYKFEVE